jgi:hypothetical protein
MRQIVDKKRQRRLALAALTFPEKVRIVEQMRASIAPIKRKRGVAAMRPAGSQMSASGLRPAGVSE